MAVGCLIAILQLHIIHITFTHHHVGSSRTQRDRTHVGFGLGALSCSCVLFWYLAEGRFPLPTAARATHHPASSSPARNGVSHPLDLNPDHQTLQGCLLITPLDLHSSFSWFPAHGPIPTAFGTLQYLTKPSTYLATTYASKSTWIGD